MTTITEAAYASAAAALCKVFNSWSHFCLPVVPEYPLPLDTFVLLVFSKHQDFAMLA
jgi:hypothetical protein